MYVDLRFLLIKKFLDLLDITFFLKFEALILSNRHLLIKRELKTNFDLKMDKNQFDFR